MEKQVFTLENTNDGDALNNFVEWEKNYQELNLMTKEELIKRVIYLENEIQSLMD